MNLKCTGFLTAIAVSAVMAQNETPAAEVAAPAATPAPVEQAAPAPAAPIAEQATHTEDKFTQVEKELAPENLFSEPTAVRGEDAAKPVVKETTKKFVYRPVYSPSEVETSGAPVKTIYVTEKPSPETIDTDELRGLIPLKFTFGLQGFIGNEFLSGDNGRYEYDSYSGLTWNVGAFALIPLDEYNMAIKTGVMFEHDKVSNSFGYNVDGKYGEYRATFNQYRISIPLLLSLKGAKSNLHFDVGVQPSFAVSDNFKLKSSGKTTKFDMMDKDYRSAIDWSIVVGFGIRANRYIGFDARFCWGLNNQYDDFPSDVWGGVNNLSSKAVSVGATFYAL
jgi:hypothetical protein